MIPTSFAVYILVQQTPRFPELHAAEFLVQPPRRLQLRLDVIFLPLFYMGCVGCARLVTM